MSIPIKLEIINLGHFGNCDEFEASRKKVNEHTRGDGGTMQIEYRMDQKASFH